jgi:hypothetical protein
MRAMALALRGAAVAATVFVVPGGPLLALPAIWRFVTRVQAEAASIRPRIGSSAGMERSNGE